MSRSRVTPSRAAARRQAEAAAEAEALVVSAVAGQVEMMANRCSHAAVGATLAIAARGGKDAILQAGLLAEEVTRQLAALEAQVARVLQSDQA
jgi:hypothetical protein